MFGSDNMVWPQTIEIGIKKIEQATFITDEQIRDILFNNATRFLRLTEMQIKSMQ
jgi:predicted TIM-barrel fold metal-dependent hydrolase